MIATAKAIGYDRASFDRCEQLRVQPRPITAGRMNRRASGEPGGRALSSRAIVNEPLDLEVQRRQVTRLFSQHEGLQHHRIQSGTRQRDSPARFGQEKRWRRPAHHENGAAHFRAKFAAAAYLGAGAEEVRSCSRHGARSQDDQ